MNSISPNLNIMIKASEKASKVLIRDFGEIEKLQVSKKGPSDFVTNSDLKTEKIIISELKKAKPNFKVLGPKYGKDIQEIVQLVNSLKMEEINALENGKNLNIEGNNRIYVLNFFG